MRIASSKASGAAMKAVPTTAAGAAAAAEAAVAVGVATALARVMPKTAKPVRLSRKLRAPTMATSARLSPLPATAAAAVVAEAVGARIAIPRRSNRIAIR